MTIEIRQGYNIITSEANKVDFLDMANCLENAGHKFEKIVLVLKEVEEDDVQNVASR